MDQTIVRSEQWKQVVGYDHYRSCHQARSYCNTHPEVNFKTESDRRYAIIMRSD